MCTCHIPVFLVLTVDRSIGVSGVLSTGQWFVQGGESSAAEGCCSATRQNGRQL